MFRNGSHLRPTTARRARAAAAVLALGIGVAAGTAGASGPPASEPGGTAAAPENIDPDASVAVGFVLEPTNLDILHTAGAALDQVLLDNVYETLLTSTPEGEIGPGLATLEVSEDGLTYTLSLHEGVTFSNGDALTAADVVWSLQQLGAPGAATSAESTAPAGTEPAAPAGLRAADFANVASVEATDDATVVLTLAERDNDLAWNLSRRAGAVVQEGATDLESTAVGTGPFLLAEWAQGSSITLERNEEYWAGDVPQVAEVVFQYFTEPNAATTALEQGDVDLITGVGTDLVGQFEDNPDYVVSNSPTNGEVTLGMNTQAEALSDPLVRQAITHAIDKQGVLDLNNGFGTIIGAPVPPTDPWYEDQTALYPYDLEAARAKLAEAGYADGLELTFVVPNIYPTAIPDYVVSQLGEIGIEVDLQIVEFTTWLEQVYTNHDYDLSYVIHVEPRDLDIYANPEYYFQYDNPEVQQLVADAKVAADAGEQVELLRQAAAIIAEDAPAVWLLLFHDVLVARTGVSGYPTYDVQSRFDASEIVVAA
jgi:peptide/nickel transport system substrate-binding protein